MKLHTSKPKKIIVIKLGTSSICDEKTHEPLLSNLSLIVETCVKLKREGYHVVLVSSGAIGIGLRRLRIDSRPAEVAKAQAIAAVGQCRLIALWDKLFEQLDQPVGQILLTRNDIADKNRYTNARNTFRELLNEGIIPIVNENDTLAVSEIKFGDNDTLSAITAGMLHADYLFLMTDVDCLYTNNPRTHPDAQPIEVVEDISSLVADVSSAGSSVGTGGMATKITAARLGTSAGVTVIICKSSQPSNIFHIVAHIEHLRTQPNTPIGSPHLVPTTPDEPVGQHSQLSSVLQADHAVPSPRSRPSSRQQSHSRPASPHHSRSSPGPCPPHTRFLPKPRTLSGHRFMVLHGITPHGTIFVDEGAYRALTRRHRAGLLPAGVVRVEGPFQQEEAVKLCVVRPNEHGELEAEEFGRAVPAYSSAEIDLIKGRQSTAVHEILGYADSEYVVHRANIAVFESPGSPHPFDHEIPAKESVPPSGVVSPMRGVPRRQDSLSGVTSQLHELQMNERGGLTPSHSPLHSPPAQTPKNEAPALVSPSPLAMEVMPGDVQDGAQ
ncbi:glutamate 5-kinase [Ascobolus immersus RN42]|uniref:Glutamate 5-kinase n=1 Tax=Ascobolus immersus RN42 TaxID=1160509 RepID=A0A3N4IP19_ASCIM|nr:glutamate 5-kinase [Ascobolus immersus RN42]